MIFAAGLGTRLKPLTDTMPKAMVPVGGSPLLQYVINKIRNAGISDIVVNVHHFADQIIDYTKGDEHIFISDETDLLRETGGAIRHAAPLLFNDDYILIHNVDILSNVDLQKFVNIDATVEAQLLISRRETQRYLLFDDDMRLVGWINTKTGEVKTPYENLNIEKCKKFAFAGIHLFGTRLLKEMKSWSEKFSIIDFYLAMCAEHKIIGYIQPDLQLLDVGKLDTLEKAEQFIRQ